MLNENETIDLLIVGYLTGEASSEEQKELLRWLGESPTHKEYFAQIRDVWMAAAQAEDLSAETCEQALQRFHERRRPMSVVEKRRLAHEAERPKWRPRLLRYAAVAALMVAATFTLTQIFMNRWLQGQSSEMVYETRYGSRGEVELPDHSHVYLNAGSRLTFRSDYNFRQREVCLTGEAFFDVQTNPQKPFIVKAGNINIRATGTSFNVKAYPEEEQITTTLVKGIVTIEGTDKNQRPFALKMKPDQCITYFKDDSLFTKVITSDKIKIKPTTSAKPDTAPNKIDAIAIPAIVKAVDTKAQTSWTGERWVIDNESFADLAVKLERRYNISVCFESEELKCYRYSGIIERETPEQIFDIIRYSIPLSYTIDRGAVVLRIDEKLKKKYQHNFKIENKTF